MPLEQLLGPGNINKLQIWQSWGSWPNSSLCVFFWADLPGPLSPELLFLIQNKVFQRTITKPCHWISCWALLGTLTSCRFDLTRMLLHHWQMQIYLQGVSTPIQSTAALARVCIYFSLQPTPWYLQSLGNSISRFIWWILRRLWLGRWSTAVAMPSFLKHIIPLIALMSKLVGFVLLWSRQNRDCSCLWRFSVLHFGTLLSLSLLVACSQ